MVIKYLVLFSLNVFLLFNAFSQSDHDFHYLMFYNVENLFDHRDDPVTSDEEFTSGGLRRWTMNRFQNKILNLSKVFLNVPDWNAPAMIALCEVENRYVLEQLLTNTPLGSEDYNFIHKDSPDERGIDVAFLYREKIFYPLEYRYLPLITSEGEVAGSREILYVSGIIGDRDTIHIFVNHWPSRYSGVLESKSMRIQAAKILRSHIDRVYSKFANPAIVILGDFNDSYSDESLSDCLKARTEWNNINPQFLYNLSSQWDDKDCGTIKYRGQWLVFDQIIVNGALMVNSGGLYVEPDNAEILKLPFLFEKDRQYGGIKPNRTYSGFRYNGGFSDHLPVILKLKQAPRSDF